MLRTLVSNKKNGWGTRKAERDEVFWGNRDRERSDIGNEYINMDCDG